MRDQTQQQLDPLDGRLPTSVDAEREVLSAILWNGAKIIHRVQPIIGPDDFHRVAYRLIFDAMAIVEEAGEVELGLVVECLRGRGELDRAGGREAVSALMDYVPNSAQIEKYAEMIRVKSRLRLLVRAGHELARNAMEPGAVPDDLLADFELAAASIGGTGEGARALCDIVGDTIRQSDARVARGELLGIRTSFECINRSLLGFQRGALTVVAANTSVGKTAFGLQVCEDAVRGSAGVRVVGYQAEMTEAAVANRYLARNCRIPLPTIREWKHLSEFERASIDKYAGRLRDFRSRLHIASQLRTITAIVADMKQRKADGGLDLAVVDYIQLIDPAVTEQRRDLEVSAIALRFVEIAATLNIAIVALSQVTNAGNGRLTTESLRESKAVGHHARNVLILDRPRQMNKADTTIPKCYTTLQIEKQSEGETGDFILHFDGRYQTFTEGDCPTGCPFGATYGERSR